jgi:hypothetical protein
MEHASPKPANLRTAVIVDWDSPRRHDIVNEAVAEAATSFPPDVVAIYHDHAVKHAVDTLYDYHRTGRDDEPWAQVSGWYTTFMATKARYGGIGSPTNIQPARKASARTQVGADADHSNTEIERTPSCKGKPLPKATPFAWRMLKRREWLHANHYIRGFVSATIAPGGVGKSTNAIVEVLAMATGLPLPHRTALRTAPGKRLRVWYVNGEDPIEETERRFQAAMLHFGIKPGDVEGRLFIDSGHDQNFVFARENGRVVTVVEPVVDSVMAAIKEKGIDCLILDPVVSFHAVAENDNTKLQQVLEQFSAVANQTKVSVELVAHTRKANGNEITADDARGASALHDKVRSLRTVNRMTEKEGEKVGLSAGEFKSVFRLDHGKASMTKGGAGSTWRRLVSVRIESGDDVGVCEAWHWPSVEDLADDLTIEQLEKVKVTLASGNWRENRQAKDWAGYAVMLAVGLDPDDKDLRPKAHALLAGLIHSGTLKVETREDRSQGRSVKYVVTA